MSEGCDGVERDDGQVVSLHERVIYKSCDYIEMTNLASLLVEGSANTGPDMVRAMSLYECAVEEGYSFHGN